jgi:hypothetical protein
MTVKSLSPVQKAEIAVSYSYGKYTVNELATIYDRSSRTIIRALEEQGIKDVVKKRKPKVPVTIPTKTPWWKRVTKWFSGEARP